MNKIINDCNVPKPVYDAFVINSNSYSRGKSDFSPSNILLGARDYYLSKRNPGDTVSNLSDGWAAFLGNLIHIGFEELLKKYTGPGTYMLEDRFFLEFHGKVISGATDGIYINPNGNVTYFDYKTMQGKQYIDDDKKEEWEIKANIYKYLIEKNTPHKLTNLTYIGLWRDWKKSAFLTNQELKPTEAVKLPMWDTEKIEAFLRERIDYFEKYKDTPSLDIPYCNNKERWNKKREFKVGKATAVGKVEKGLPKMSYPTMDEALDALKIRSIKKPKEKLGIKVMGGGSIKCRNYCSNSEECGFMKEYPTGELDD